MSNDIFGDFPWNTDDGDGTGFSFYEHGSMHQGDEFMSAYLDFCGRDDSSLSLQGDSNVHDVQTPSIEDAKAPETQQSGQASQQADPVNPTSQNAETRVTSLLWQPCQKSGLNRPVSKGAQVPRRPQLWQPKEQVGRLESVSQAAQIQENSHLWQPNQRVGVLKPSLQAAQTQKSPHLWQPGQETDLLKPTSILGELHGNQSFGRRVEQASFVGSTSKQQLLGEENDRLPKRQADQDQPVGAKKIRLPGHQHEQQEQVMARPASSESSTGASPGGNADSAAGSSPDVMNQMDQDRSDSVATRASFDAMVAGMNTQAMPGVSVQPFADQEPISTTQHAAAAHDTSRPAAPDRHSCAHSPMRDGAAQPPQPMPRPSDLGHTSAELPSQPAPSVFNPAQLPCFNSSLPFNYTPPRSTYTGLPQPNAFNPLQPTALHPSGWTVPSSLQSPGFYLAQSPGFNVLLPPWTNSQPLTAMNATQPILPNAVQLTPSEATQSTSSTPSQPSPSNVAQPTPSDKTQSLSLQSSELAAADPPDLPAPGSREEKASSSEQSSASLPPSQIVVGPPQPTRGNGLQPNNHNASSSQALDTTPRAICICCVTLRLLGDFRIKGDGSRSSVCDTCLIPVYSSRLQCSGCRGKFSIETFQILPNGYRDTVCRICRAAVDMTAQLVECDWCGMWSEAQKMGRLHWMNSSGPRSGFCNVCITGLLFKCSGCSRMFDQGSIARKGATHERSALCNDCWYQVVDVL